MDLERMKKFQDRIRFGKTATFNLDSFAGVGEYLLGCANTMRELDGFGTIR